MWPPPFCVDCLIFCISIPVSPTPGLATCCFYFYKLKEDLIIPVCCKTSLPLCRSTKNRILLSLLSFISCHFFLRFSIFTVILPTSWCDPSHHWNDLGYWRSASVSPPQADSNMSIITISVLPPVLCFYATGSLARPGSEAALAEYTTDAATNCRNCTAEVSSHRQNE